MSLHELTEASFVGYVYCGFVSVYSVGVRSSELTKPPWPAPAFGHNFGPRSRANRRNHFEIKKLADEIAQDLESFKSSTCSAAPTRK